MYLPKIRLDHWQGESCVTAVPNWSVSSQIRDRPESIRSIDPWRNQYNRRIQQLRVTESLRKETPISLPGLFYSPPRNLLLTAEHHKIPFRIKLHYLCLQKQLGFIESNRHDPIRLQLEKLSVAVHARGSTWFLYVVIFSFYDAKPIGILSFTRKTDSICFLLNQTMKVNNDRSLRS